MLLDAIYIDTYVNTLQGVFVTCTKYFFDAILSAMLDTIPTNETAPTSGRGRPTGSGGQTSDAVKAVRAKLGLTQQQLAQEINCSLSAVRYMERERRLPGTLSLLDSFKRLAKRAGVSLEAKAEEVAA